MSNLRLITSRSNNYSIKKAIELLSSESRDIAQEFIVIVPEKFSLSVERLLLLSSDKKAISNVQVVTLSRLLKKLLSTENNYLSKQAGVMVVKSIILENIDKLVCFKKSSRTIGFAQEIFDTISILKNSQVNPEDINRILSTTKGALKLKLQDIYLIYSEYENFITGRYIDASDRFGLLSDLIELSKGFFGVNTFVLGFEFMSESGYKVIKSLITKSKHTTVACSDMSGSANSYLATSEMLDAMLQVAGELGIKPTRIFYKEDRSDLARHLSENLFSYPYKKIKNNGEINIFSAPDIVEEVTAVAKTIRGLVTEGERYKSFAIACPVIDNYQSVIKSVFYDFDIPVFLDTAESLSTHSLSKFVISALSVIIKNYAKEEVVGFVKNYFAGFGSTATSIFENYIIEEGVSFDGFKKPFCKGDQCEAAEQVRTGLVDGLKSFESYIKKSTTARDYVKSIEQLLADFEVKNKVEMFAKKQSEIGDLEKASATVQVEDKINIILQDCAQILGSTSIKAEEFLSILASGMNATKISFIPETVDSVFVGDISTSKFFDSSYLFVIGATDTDFPSTKSDCGIIVDSEVLSMSKNISKKIEPTIRTINRRERYKVFELLQLPSKKLYISYPTSDLDGRAITPSTVIKDIRKIYANDIDTDMLKDSQSTTRQTRGDIYKTIGHNYSSRRVAEKALFESLSQGGLAWRVQPSLYKAVFGGLNKHSQEVFDRKFRGDGEKFVKNSKKLFFPKNTTSITQLETYFACPYQHYMRHGLKARERKDARLEAIDVGSILHAIAELFVRDIETTSKLSEKEATKKVDSIINSVLNKDSYYMSANQYIIKRLINESHRMCKALVFQYKNSKFKPIGQEVVFGKGGLVGGVNTKSGISIEGKIDRLDATDSELRVVDYKSGSFAVDFDEIYYGSKIQLFMYLKAFENYKNLRPVGAFYLPLSDTFVDENKGKDFLSTYTMQGYVEGDEEVIKKMDTSLGFDNPQSKVINVKISSSKENRDADNFVVSNSKQILPKGAITELSDYVARLSDKATDEILGGYITPSPREKSKKLPCDYCEFFYTCGFNSGNTNPSRKIKTTTLEDILSNKDEQDE